MGGEGGMGGTLNEPCFSHFDCDPDQRCRNQAGPGAEVEDPRCELGERGALMTGEECAGEDAEVQCASGVCVEGFCSEQCELDEDCPAPFVRCFPIIADWGDAGSWCL